MLPILFLFVMQAFLDTLQLPTPPGLFSHFPENKNGNPSSQKGCLLSQNPRAKGTPFAFSSSFYVDDSFFLFQSKSQLEQAVAELDKHFARFGLIMHLGTAKVRSKSEAMYFPPSLKQAREEFEKNILPDDIR